MKKIALMVVACAGIAFLGAEDKKPQVNTSYAMGLAIGQSVKELDLPMDYTQFLDGLKDVLENRKAKCTPEEAQAAIQVAVEAGKTKKAEAAKTQGVAYLAENKKKAGVKVTASGLQYEILTPGKGAKPSAKDTVKVHYTGKLLDGKVFDSSVQRNEPAVFPLEGVIPGWTEGLQLMNVGSKFRFTIPSELAYGAQGAGGMIPAHAVLVFEVELLNIEAPEPAGK